MAYGSNLVRLLYLLTFLAEAAVLWALLRRRLHREVPWVTKFLLYVLARDMIVYPLYELADAMRFYYLSWILEVGAMTLITVFLLEIFRHALAEYAAARNLGRNVLIVAAIVLAVIAVSTAPYGATHSILTTKIVMVTERSIRIVHVGLIVAFFCFARYLALSLKNYQFGILLGYGLYAASNLAVAALNAQMGAGVAYKTMLIDAVTYVCMYLIWLAYLLKREPTAPPGSPPIGGKELEQWSQALSDLRKQ